LLALGVQPTVTADAGAASLSSSPIPKSQRPANVNPRKAPITDPGKIKPDPVLPLSDAQRRSQAKAWVARDPNARVACFNPDGTVAGMVVLDRVNPLIPLSPAEAAVACMRGWPASRP